ncbi:PSD1 and planctomycete cytochrome C domain-containing protein [Aquisphaera insulae]|uniref:PSD1 and planctomycete cytochrome C domain-containing protein n=1 Tax=Aquisphaera insulae TaxID=2712864 RepID=UPI0013EAE10E|nr:PSD1 and planctomycete cytochrome C domain-containing protein [Aquisphaera insulae]
MRRPIGVAIVLASFPLGTARAGEPPADRAARLQKGRAVLVESCVSCHNADQKKGKLDLTRPATALAGGESGPAIVPGKAGESLAVEKVEAGEMPPKGRLEPAQVEALRAWIDAGASYPAEPLTSPRAGADWWSLRPIARPSPPALAPADAALARNPIDAFLLAELRRKGIDPAPEADRRDLIRRLSFDLIGLPPAPEEVERFVADRDPMAYEHLVDRLLASPQHGERWGRHWLDVVRFGESEGYETNMPRFNAWPYRDYVIRAFNRDTPFPRFVLEHLAGDALGDGDRADWLTRAATGFLVGGTHDIVGNQTIEGMKQQRVDDLDDIITATATGFLGLTANCARCHDHKFDPITQRDYYGLQAVLAGVQHGSRQVDAPDAPARREAAARIGRELAAIDRQLDEIEPLALAGEERVRAAGGSDEASHERRPRSAVGPLRNVERFRPRLARMVRFTVLATNTGSEPCVDEVEVMTAGDAPRNVALAAAGGKAAASSEYPDAAIHKVPHLNDGLTGNDHSWISREPGRGSFTVEWPRAVLVDRIVWSRDRNGAYADRLATNYRVEVAEAAGAWQVVASSADRVPEGAAAAEDSDRSRRAELLARQASLRARLGELGPTISVYAGTFAQPGPTHLLRRGDPMQPGAEVVPSGIAAVRPALTIPATAAEKDRRLALARWIGDPANPLPARVMVNRAWLHHFGQGIVSTPSDFGFNGGPPSHPELLDWLASRYIDEGWRLKPIHRLIVTSAAYRRSGRADPRALAVDAGNRLLWRMPPRRLEAEPLRDAILACSGQLDPTMGGPGYNIWEKNTNYVAVYRPRASLGPDAFRRMIYQFKPRSQEDPTFGAFDCPGGALVTPRRNASTTALQALNLLNSEFVADQAGRFAERLRREGGEAAESQARRGFLLAFGREPSAGEEAAAAALIRERGAAAICRALYNANEFVFVP